MQPLIHHPLSQAHAIVVGLACYFFLTLPVLADPVGKDGQTHYGYCMVTIHSRDSSPSTMYLSALFASAHRYEDKTTEDYAEKAKDAQNFWNYVRSKYGNPTANQIFGGGDCLYSSPDAGFDFSKPHSRYSNAFEKQSTVEDRLRAIKTEEKSIPGLVVVEVEWSPDSQ